MIIRYYQNDSMPVNTSLHCLSFCQTHNPVHSPRSFLVNIHSAPPSLTLFNHLHCEGSGYLKLLCTAQHLFLTTGPVPRHFALCEMGFLVVCMALSLHLCPSRFASPGRLILDHLVSVRLHLSLPLFTFDNVFT